MSEPFIGEIRLFAGNFAPRGWAFCNGQILSISQNTALYSILGTTYGGNGQTTFALPDLRGRAPIHPGQGPGLSPRTLGEQAGEESHTLLQNEMPAHTHGAQSQVNSYSGAGDAASPGNAYPAGSASRDTIYSNSTDGTMHSGMVQTNVGVAGQSQPHNNMQPYLAVNYIIALEGIFPSRN